MPPNLIPAEWDAFVAAQARSTEPPLRHPAGHILQTSAWAKLKSRFGWSPDRVVLREEGSIVAGAQLLFRRLPLGLGSIAYAPKGPLVDWSHPDHGRRVLALCDQAAKARRAVLLKLEPDLPDEAETRTSLSELGLQPSPQTIQPPRTLLVDLTPSEPEILARMKQKTRYNIRLADKKGVTVRATTSDTADADLRAFNALLRVTGERDRFGVHAPGYYRLAYEYFSPDDRAAVFLAEYEGRPLAAIMVFALGRRAWYFYGASSNEERGRMPAYAAQWAALRWAKARGCHTYDLWGVPDAEEHELEAHFTARRDGLWPVYRFKRGFGGRLARSTGAWDRVYVPWAYRLYCTYLNWSRGATA